MKSLRSRLVISHLLPTLLVLPLLSLSLLYIVESQVLLVDLAQNLTRLALVSAQDAAGRPALWQDAGQAEEFASQYRQAYQREIILLRPDGAAQAGAPDGGLPLPPPTLDELRIVLSGQPLVKSEYSLIPDSNHVEVFVPVLDSSLRVVGIVRVTDRLGDVYASFQAIRILVISATLLALLVAAGLGFLLARRTELRLQAVANAIEQVAASDPAQAARSAPAAPLTPPAQPGSPIPPALPGQPASAAQSATPTQLTPPVQPVSPTSPARPGQPAPSAQGDTPTQLTRSTQPSPSARPTPPAHLPPEFERLFEAVSDLSQRLTTSEAARKRLLANLVHEVARPLGALQAAVHALQQGAAAEPALRQELLQGMDEQIERLKPLLDNLASLYSLSGQPVELKLEMVKLEEWLPGILVTWQAAAQAKGLEWQTRLEAGLPPVMIDSGRMAQVLGNLLANAIQYTPKGGSIRVETGRLAAQVWIAVQDSGIGITPEERPQIFDPFYRGPRARRFPQGMGLGLSIAADIVRLHAGELQVDSEPGRGSRFTVYLPG